jgi:hypothetical protein
LLVGSASSYLLEGRSVVFAILSPAIVSRFTKISLASGLHLADDAALHEFVEQEACGC